MGIPSYFSHIVRKHRSIIKLLNSPSSPTINNLYLDCNSFIYEAVHTLPPADLNEEAIIQHVCDSLIKYITLLKPNKRVLIAFDGVAPMAKLDQQRNRRYMTAFQNSLDSATADGGGGTVKWNTNAITPGTAFMEKLGKAVTARFAAAYASEFGLEMIIVSTSNDPGEGEHKIFEYIREHASYHQATSTVIYGLDADLIMLTLNHLHISEKLYLFRETPEFIKNIDKTLNPNHSYILDIPLFAQNIIQELSTSHSSSVPVSLNNDILFDYIFICFLLGNDFLPHFPALNIRTNGITHLINAYKFVFNGKKDSLTKNREIIWKNVRSYIAHLAANEVDFLQEEYVYRQRMSKREVNPKDATLMLPITERATELYINPFEAGWEARYYSSLFNIKIDDDRRKEIATNYLAGLEWTMKYYSTGCVNWRWRYNYYYPPLLTDLLKYVPYFDHTFVPTCAKNPVSAVVQLSYVLPPISLNLIPANVRAKLLPEWYVGNYVFLWAFCKFFWEAHVDLPHIDIDVLEGIVQSA
jgi:5'-3' exoribonuclease 1